MTARHPCCDDCLIHGDRPTGFDLHAGDMDAIGSALLKPTGGPTLEETGAEWRAQIALENSLTPCAACPRFVLAGELCECDDEMGPFCPSCHRDHHGDDRAYWGGVA